MIDCLMNKHIIKSFQYDEYLLFIFFYFFYFLDIYSSYTCTTEILRARNQWRQTAKQQLLKFTYMHVFMEAMLLQCDDKQQQKYLICTLIFILSFNELKKRITLSNILKFILKINNDADYVFFPATIAYILHSYPHLEH